MSLDPWSIVLSLVLSVFGFLVFLLWNKRYELSMIERKVAPAIQESHDVLIKNFLSFGEIPTKSKLVSIMTSVARKHQVQLMTHLSIQNVIDSLVYYVISNDLLDPYKKKEISDSLIRLKLEQISQDDYLQIIADSEESLSWRQKISYAQLTKVLIFASLTIIVLGVSATQFKGFIGPQLMYLMNWILVSSIGFSALIAGYTLWLIFSYFSTKKISNANANGLLMPPQMVAESVMPVMQSQQQRPKVHSQQRQNNASGQSFAQQSQPGAQKQQQNGRVMEQRNVSHNRSNGDRPADRPTPSIDSVVNLRSDSNKEEAHIENQSPVEEFETI